MILTANFPELINVFYLSLWTRAMHSAYLLDTSGHWRSFI